MLPRHRVVDVDDNKQNVQYKSEYNMGQFYFERYHEILKDLDRLAFFVGKAKYDRQYFPYVTDFLAALRVLFNNLQAPMEDSKRQEIIGLFKAAELGIGETFTKSKGNKIFPKGMNQLLRLHQYLLELMQYMGLGIIVSKKQSPRKKLKTLLHGGEKDA